MYNERVHFHGRGRGMKQRFFHWAAGKMTGEEAFGIFFGEKDKTYPEAMKKEFAELFDQSRETMKKVHEERKAFMEKWSEYTGKESFGGDPRFEGRGPGSGEEDFRDRGDGFPGRGHGFGW